MAVLLGRGDGTFAPASLFATGSLPTRVVVADFNHDGNLDVATANVGDGSVSVLLGQGDGTFAAPQEYLVGPTPFGLVAGDFNGDGNLDLATANLAGGSVTILDGRGDGTFTPGAQLTAGYAPSYVTSADFNGDGTPDLAVLDSATNLVWVFLGQAGGGFASPVCFAAGAPPTDPTVAEYGGLAVADINRDGIPDLAVTTTAGVHLLLGQGRGGNWTFQDGGQLTVGETPMGIVSADFNRDGNADLVTANYGSNDVSVLLGHGDGTFHDQVRTPVPNGPMAVLQTDLTGNGQADLVTADYDAGTVSVRVGVGDGRFQAPVSFAVGQGPDALASADFNGDGRADLAVANYLDGTVSVLFGVGDGSLVAAQTYAVGQNPDALVVGDFNGDGIPDLAVANYGSGTVSILLGRRDGTFQGPRTIAVGAGPHALAVGDVNGDGIPDLVVGDYLSGDVRVLLGNGDGSFRVQRSLPLGVGPAAVVLGAFTGRGHLDIATADPSDDSVSLLVGNGDGTFQAPTRFAAGAAPVSLVAGDFNQDGHPDLLVADNGANAVALLAGQGNGTFLAPASFAVGGYPFALAAADFNGDGKLDVATADGQGDPVSVLLGLGDGTFVDGARAYAPVRSTPHVADLNGDGVPDVAVLADDGTILVRLGDPQAPGTFEPPVVLNPDPAQAARDLTLLTVNGTPELAALDASANTLAFYVYQSGIGFRRVAGPTVPGGIPVRITAGDVNGDGRQDLVVATAGSPGQVDVFLQQPDGSFGPAADQASVGSSPADLALVDLDGTGRPDLVVTDAYSGDVRILENTAAVPFASQLTFRAGSGLYEAVGPGGAADLYSQDAPVALAAGRFGGALPSLVVADRGADGLSLLANDGLGGLFNPVSPLTWGTGGAPGALVLGDFNGDGGADLAVLNQDGNVTIFLGDGHGGLTKGQTLAAGNGPTGLAVADLNRDGKPDLLAGNAQGDVLALLGNGDGTFRPYQRLGRHVALAVTGANASQPEFVFADQSLDRVSVQSAQPGASWQQGRQDGVLAPNAVTLADLNGDGLPDLLVANGGGNDVLFYPGLGNGVYGSAERFYAGTNPVGITVADLNGDGLPDLVVANQGSNDVSLLYGQGQGAGWTLTSGPRLRVGSGPVDTVVRDVNGDGIPDLLVANSQSNDVFLLPGVGHGFFNDTDPTVYQTGQEPVQLFVGRFDDQPGLDLVTVNRGSNDLTFFAAFGPGRAIGTAGDDPVAAVAGDFNHDGMNELIVANADGHFTLLQGNADGMQVQSVLAPAHLADISDLALGRVDGNTVEVFATVDGKDAAVSVVLDLGPVLPGGAASADLVSAETVSRPAIEFSAASGSSLEVVATLTLGSADLPGAEDLSAEAALPLQTAAAVRTVDSGEAGADDAEGMTLAAADDGLRAMHRNALLTGADETPVLPGLQGPKKDQWPDVEVPFPSPSELFDGTPSVLLDPRWQEVVRAVSRDTARDFWVGRFADETEPAAAAGEPDPSASALAPESDRAVCAAAEPCQGPTPGRVPARPTDQRADAVLPRSDHARALALGLALTVLTQENPGHARRDRSRSPLRSDA